MTEQILCYSCSKSKFKISVKKSKLITGINIMLCDQCIILAYEPRWIIILAGREFGSDKVKDYILNHKYYGEEISATELLV